MAFIGEGIAHAGFGGLGTALFLGLTGSGLAAGGTWKTDLVVLAFCLATALAIGMLTRRRHVEPDSAIGIMLVAAMAWGVLMIDLHRNLQGQDWYIRLFGSQPRAFNTESFLFGSLTNVGPYDAWLAVGAAMVILLLLAALFKEILFYAFDETVSQVFGVPTRLIHYLMLALLSVTIVLTVRLAGIVLVSALLVIPGATASLLSRRLGRVLAVALSWHGRSHWRIIVEPCGRKSLDRPLHRGGALRAVRGGAIAISSSRRRRANTSTSSGELSMRRPACVRFAWSVVSCNYG